MYPKYIWLVLVFSQHISSSYAKKPANPHDSVVRIVLSKSKNEGFGALVSDRHVLTVADLVSKGEDLTLRFENGQVDIVKFSNVHIHKEYQSGSVTDNIAFIRLPTPVDFTDSVYSIRWPRNTDWPLTYDNYKVEIITVDARSSSKEIITVASTIVKHKDCQNANGYILTEGNFCFKLNGSGKLQCGKNTGALITYENKGVLRLLGISTSYNKCNRGFQIATRLVEYSEWFQYNIVK